MSLLFFHILGIFRSFYSPYPLCTSIYTALCFFLFICTFPFNISVALLHSLLTHNIVNKRRLNFVQTLFQCDPVALYRYPLNLVAFGLEIAKLSRPTFLFKYFSLKGSKEHEELPPLTKKLHSLFYFRSVFCPVQSGLNSTPALV